MNIMKMRTRELVVLAVLITLTVISRMIFALTPSFKPVAAMVILTGMAFGAGAGGICGGLSAFISNFFFGQGPWTPYQMLAMALIGISAGVLNKKQLLEKYPVIQIAFGIVCGIAYSMIMDIWTCTGFGDAFILSRYLAVCVTSIPTTVIYCVSNTIFLLVLTPVMLKKMIRVKYKYGFYREYEWKECAYEENNN